MAGALFLDTRIAERLAAAAKARGESVDQLATRAIEKFLDWDHDFSAALMRGVEEADAREFASESDVKCVFRRRV